MMMSFRVAPPFPLIFLLMIHRGSSAGYSVSYSSSHICALKHASVIMSCTYTYPPGHQIEKVFWTKNPVYGGEYPDLSEDPEYSQRLQYLGDKQQNCTIRLSNVTQKDSHEYYFRIIIDKDKYLGEPGVTLTVTDLQVKSPERVTEGDSVNLTCNSSCALTDRATFIWYRDSQPLTERRDRNNHLLLQSVRREDAGRYSCGVQEHDYSLRSPDVQLTVTYPPRSVSVSISPSGVIVEGDSVTLSCSSDSNPPAEISWIKRRITVGSGRIYNISKIRSDHSGEYRCYSQNKHGYEYSDAVTLNIMYPPKSVSVSINGSSEIVEGDSVTLSCSSDSNPPAEISWIKGGTTVGSGRIYSISKIRSDHSGEYRCYSQNKHGYKYSDAVTLNIIYPPRNVSAFIQSGQFWEEGSVSLICSSDSNPPALNFIWFKEDLNSSVGSGQSFRTLQSGRFYCEAHNQHGSQRSDAVTVTVEEGRLVILYISIGLVCGAVVIITVVVIWRSRVKKRKGKLETQVNHSRADDNRYIVHNVETTERLYENVMMNHPVPHNGIKSTEPVYENIMHGRP